MDMGTGWRRLLASMLLAGAMTAEAGDTADSAGTKEDPIFIRTQAGVQVDASGHVVAVELDPELPSSLRSYADKVIGGWMFSPVMQDGRAVGGKTYANVNLCLMPSGDYFNVGLEFAGNGPGNADADRRAQVPPFPSSVLSSRSASDHMEIEGRVRYRVDPDGQAELVSATFDDPKLQQRHGRSWHRQVRKWLGKRRFQPEIINGQPVATTMELPIEFRLNALDSIDEMRDKHARQVATRDSCQMAAGSPDRQEVAVDSRFVLLPDA